MRYVIESIDLFVREMPAPRMPFVIGRRLTATGATAASGTPMLFVRMVVATDDGRRATGCAADRMSVRWLDKRADRSEEQKLADLASLAQRARGAYMAEPRFESPFEKWLAAYRQIVADGRRAAQEDLSSAMASAVHERAMLDAVARIEGASMFDLVRHDRLGVRPAAIHSTLGGFDWRATLPPRPLTQFYIRHTVGLADPLTQADLTDANRIGDGLPETLEDYIRTDGMRYFKIKIGGAIDDDVTWLERIDDVLTASSQRSSPAGGKPAAFHVTLDANEAYADLAMFFEFVERLRRDRPRMWNRILYLEQPVPRDRALAVDAAGWIRRIGLDKPMIIDESDATLDSYPRAHALGYAGTSHKNCKGFFKSLVNHALAAANRARGCASFLSGEDLTNLPIVPLHQDYVALGILGLAHCERNAHHYHYGLAHLTERELATVAAHHRDLYEERDGEWFVKIREGMIDCASLQSAPFGVIGEPDWQAMTPLERWRSA